MAILLMAELSDDQQLVESFGLLVVCTRIFGYGLRSYLIEDKTAELVREISVGVFFEILKKANVLKLTKSVQLNVGQIIPAIKAIVAEIYNVEKIAKDEGIDHLVDYSVKLFTSSYPNK